MGGRTALPKAPQRRSIRPPLDQLSSFKMRFGLFACAFITLLCITSAITCDEGGKGTIHGVAINQTVTEECGSDVKFCMGMVTQHEFMEGHFRLCDRDHSCEVSNGFLVPGCQHRRLARVPGQV
ncbi:hypothetical protein L596_029436 [Steinernema carpocapsae]|uniref:Uncharacterized protein n=1 Tax=Steinernema carpocapsae TaxID=34508 RepID=A0A4U5LUM8_STECR|nr:hypothetical protein L596_029436 [Steinernema carpocapsae]